MMERLSMDHDFSPMIAEFEKEREDAEVAVPVAAMKALADVIKRSNASTMMEMELELRASAERLKAHGQETMSQSTISLNSGCDLFLRHVTRTNAATEKKVLTELMVGLAITSIGMRSLFMTLR